MTPLSPERLRELRAQARDSLDPGVYGLAYRALCAAGDREGIEIVVERFIHPRGTAYDDAAETALHGEHAREIIQARAERDPASREAQWLCQLLGETSCFHADYPILPTLLRVLGASLPQGTAACVWVLRSFEYVSRKGPMPEAAPLMRAVLRTAAGETDCDPGTVAHARRTLYVTEGDAIIPELRALVAGLPESHTLRQIVDDFIERRAAGRPDIDVYRLPWERQPPTAP